MRRLINLFVCIIVQLAIIHVVSAQSRSDLEKQRLQIIKDIEKASKELAKTKSSKEQNLSKLKALEEQMNSRKKLLNNLQFEIKLNEKTISQNQNTIIQLKEKQHLLKEQFAALARNNYMKKLSNSKWTYLLSSQNLNNLFIRWRYINQLQQYTNQKILEIQMVTGEISQKNIEIEKTKERSLVSIEETSKNVAILEKEQKEKDLIVQKLTKEEEKLKASILKREKERESLNQAIEKIILVELSKSKTKEKADGAVAKKKEIDNSGFSKNQGALDWPVTKGKITGRFGVNPHPTVKNVEVSNNGVDFTIPDDADVLCIYQGEVVGITSIPGFNIMVIIKHGSYYSVYSKLDNVVVSKGQILRLGQKIGTVVANSSGQAELHFELWKDKIKLDPQKWFNK